MKMLVVGRLSLACAATCRFPLHFTCATIAIPAKICLHTQPTTPFGLSIRACCNPSSPASPLSLPYPPPPVPPPLSSSSSSSSTSSSSSSFSAQIPCPPDYLSLSDKELFLQCNMDTYRASGPGGQHRNKTESAVRLTHLPTGLVSQAADDRSQHKNRAYALERLRMLIAVKVRRPVELDKYSPPAELTRILPAGKGQKSGGQKIGPNHSDFSKGVQCLLDLLLATEGSVSAAATKLGISTGALSKVITSDKSILLPANELRASKGLKPFR